MASQGKCTALSTEEKIEILEQLKNGQTKKAVAEERKIAVRTEQKISKDVRPGIAWVACLLPLTWPANFGLFLYNLQPAYNTQFFQDENVNCNGVRLYDDENDDDDDDDDDDHNEEKKTIVIPFVQI